MQTTLTVNNRALKVETVDGVHITAVEFCGKMITVADTGARIFAHILEMNKRQKRQLHAAWLHELAKQAVENQADLNESWSA